jgi:hypothetical protein
MIQHDGTDTRAPYVDIPLFAETSARHQAPLSLAPILCIWPAGSESARIAGQARRGRRTRSARRALPDPTPPPQARTSASRTERPGRSDARLTPPFPPASWSPSSLVELPSPLAPPPPPLD